MLEVEIKWKPVFSKNCPFHIVYKLTFDTFWSNGIWTQSALQIRIDGSEIVDTCGVPVFLKFIFPMFNINCCY